MHQANLICACKIKIIYKIELSNMESEPGREDIV